MQAGHEQRCKPSVAWIKHWEEGVRSSNSKINPDKTKKERTKQRWLCTFCFLPYLFAYGKLNPLAAACDSSSLIENWDYRGQQTLLQSWWRLLGTAQIEQFENNPLVTLHGLHFQHESSCAKKPNIIAPLPGEYQTFIKKGCTSSPSESNSANLMVHT